MRIGQLSLVALAAAFVLSTVGCSDPASDDAAEGVHGAKVFGLSSDDLVIGQTMEVYIRGLSDEAGEYRLFFDGVYRNDLGDVEEVYVTQSPIFDGDIELNGQTYKVLRISRFGPFQNPFSTSNRPGRFEGKVSLALRGDDGSFEESVQSTSVELEVRPSLIIEEFQPIDADCGAPALRALPGLAYKMRVRAVGLKPVRYEYEVTWANGSEGMVEYIHQFDEPVDVDVLGDVEPVIFNPIGDDEHFYATGIRVTAIDREGRVVETALPITVHRPIEVVLLSKKAEMAERYAPVPVSGCIPGGIATQVQYSESRTESRQRSVSMTVKSDWTDTNGTQRTASWQEGIREGQSVSRSLGGSDSEEERASESYGLTYTNDESNRVNYSTTDGETWGWSRREGETDTEYESRLNELYGSGSFSTKVGVSGEGSVPGFAKVTGWGSSKQGVTTGGSTGDRTGGARSNSVNRGHSMDSRQSERRGFGSTLTEQNSESVSGAYALSNARSRTFDDQESRTNSRTWDLNGSQSENTIVSQGISESEQSTWSESSSHQTVLNFGGRIPRNKVGMFYRQTTRMVKRAEVRAYNQCGLAEHVGELQFNEWEWAPDLALGERCEDGPPQTNLEPAACLIPPCN